MLAGARATGSRRRGEERVVHGITVFAADALAEQVNDTAIPEVVKDLLEILDEQVKTFLHARI